MGYFTTRSPPTTVTVVVLIVSATSHITMDTEWLPWDPSGGSDVSRAMNVCERGNPALQWWVLDGFCLIPTLVSGAVILIEESVSQADFGGRLGVNGFKIVIQSKVMVNIIRIQILRGSINTRDKPQSALILMMTVIAHEVKF
ncbi:hypothetical protein J6590_084129 [Homalodisca vitripennis]|nr:hypothetical protein J6590_084129 [Homalodisca vitripennis]